jgi:hypothetical protein
MGTIITQMFLYDLGNETTTSEEIDRALDQASEDLKQRIGPLTELMIRSMAERVMVAEHDARNEGEE